MSAQLSTILIGVLVFIFWLSLVGNPHVVETVMGVILATAAAWHYRSKILPKILRK